MNNRSLGFDSECDVAIEADHSGIERARTKITEIRERSDRRTSRSAT